MNYNNFYDYLQSVNEKRQRDNFNAFMLGFESGLVDKLDKMYASREFEAVKYQEFVNNLKSKGIRVFRNECGKHKVKFD